MKPLAWCLAVAAAAMAATTAGDDAQTAVQVVGLQVVRPLPGDKGKQSLTGRRTGTALTIRVHRRDKHFLGIDGTLSRLETFTDDRKTKLIDDPSTLLRTWLGGRTWASPDGRNCLFEIASLRTPARGARQVKLKAQVVLKCGRGPATAEQPGFRLAKDARLTVGPAPMKVTGVQRGDQTTIFTLTTKDSTERIARIRFFDAKGKEIATQLLDKAVVGFMGDTFQDWTYCLKTDKPARIDAVTARVEYFHKLEKLVVPVDVAVTVGL